MIEPGALQALQKQPKTANDELWYRKYFLHDNKTARQQCTSLQPVIPASCGNFVLSSSMYNFVLAILIPIPK